MPQWLTWQNFGSVADVLSVVGAIASVIAAFAVKDLRNYRIDTDTLNRARSALDAVNKLKTKPGAHARDQAPARTRTAIFHVEVLCKRAKLKNEHELHTLSQSMTDEACENPAKRSQAMSQLEVMFNKASAVLADKRVG